MTKSNNYVYSEAPMPYHNKRDHYDAPVLLAKVQNVREYDLTDHN